MSGAAAARAQVTIDDFSFAQAPLMLAAPGTVTSTVSDASIIDSDRDTVLTMSSGTSASVVVASGAFTFTTSGGSTSFAELTWDADSDPTTLDPVGLGSEDLTAGGRDGLSFTIASASSGLVFKLEVFTNASRVSTFQRVLPAVAAATPFNVPFADFSGNADFTDVGAVRLKVSGTDVDIEISAGLATVVSAAAISATKADSLAVDTDVPPDGVVDPGDTIEYQVEITSTGTTATGVDLEDTVDANTTFVAGSIETTPLALDDSYSCVGNVGIAVADGPGDLLDNDSDPDGSGLAATAISAFDATSAQGGSVAVTMTTGAFTYTPPAGFEGTDSFTYTIDDDEGNADTATVHITCEDVIWFLDNAQGAAGNGTLATPFNTLAAFEALNGNGGATDPAMGDCIFLHTGSGNYTGGVTLETGQTVVGQGAGDTVGNICGITLPTFSNALPVTTGTPVGRPDIVNAGGDGIGLATGNTIRGLDLGDTPAASQALSGTSVGSLSISEVAVSGTGGIIDVSTGGTLGVTLDSAASTSSSGTPGINLSGVSGSFTVSDTAGTDTSISGAGTGISIQGSSAAFSFGDTSVSSGMGGINLGTSTANPSATITFESLGLTVTMGSGLRASTSGTVNVGGTSNTIGATGGAALDVDDTSLGVSGWTFSSLSSTNSSARGIDLTNLPASSSLTVSGTTTVDNATDGGSATGDININTVGVGSTLSFGTTNVTNRNGTGIFLDSVSGTAGFGTTTIANPNNADGYGIRIEDSSADLTFSATNISDTNQTVAVTDAGADGFADNDGDGDGIFLKNNTGSLRIDGGTLDDLATDGIDVRNSGNLRLSGLTITDIGTGSTNPSTIPDSGFYVNNLTGTNLIQNTTIQRAQTDDIDEHFRLKNSATSYDELRFNNVDFTNTTAGTSGVNIKGANSVNISSAGSMSGTVIIENGSDFTGIRLNAIAINTGDGTGSGSGTVDIVVDGSDLDPNGLTVISGNVVVIGVANDIALGIQDDYTVNYNVMDTTLHDVQVGGTTAGVMSSVTGDLTAGGPGPAVTGRWVGNTIDDIRGRRGFNLISEGDNSSYSVTFFDNSVQDLAAETVSGASLFAREGLAVNVRGDYSNDPQLRIVDNRLGTVTPVADGSAREGINLIFENDRTGFTGAYTVDALIDENTVVVGPGGSEAIEIDHLDDPGAGSNTVNLSVTDNTLTAESDDSSDEVFLIDTDDDANNNTVRVNLDNNTATIVTQDYDFDENTGTLTIENLATVMTRNTGAFNIDGGVTDNGGAVALPTGVVIASPGRISQLATVSTAFSALEVTVLNPDGSAASGVTVTFTAPGAGASGTFPSGNTCVTPASGVCSVPFTANATDGAYKVTASAPSLGGQTTEGAIFYLRNLAL